MEDKKSKSLISVELGKELVNKGFDTSLEYAEIFIDTFVENEALKEIPLVKTVVTSINLVSTIRERANLKKLLVFLKAFHNNEISDEKYMKFKDKFSTDKKYREKVIEHILIYVDRINGVNKADVFGRLFANHIKGKINWDRFLALSICLENIHPNSFSFLDELSKKEWVVREDSYSDRNHEKEGLLSSAGISFSHGIFFTVNQLGRDLFEFGIKE